MVRQPWSADDSDFVIVGRRCLWFDDCGPSWFAVRWSWIVGPMTVVLILGHGSWFDGRGSWSDGLMVVGGGSDGPMVKYCGPMGMGRGSRCGVFNGTMGFGPGLHQSTGGDGMVGCGSGS